MDKYYIDNKARGSGKGRHLLHKDGCSDLPEKDRRLYVGHFASEDEALQHAEKIYPDSAPCPKCCRKAKQSPDSAAQIDDDCLPEEVSLDESLGIIKVCSKGKVSYEDSVNSLKKILRLSHDTGIGNVLIDTREQKFNPSAVKVYEFARSLPKSLKYALVASSDQHTAADVAFLDNVAFNRGVEIKIFPCPDTATQWLKSNDPQNRS